MAARKRPLWYGNCRDQIIRWIEDCLRVPGAFQVTHEHGQSILDQLRKVPVESNPPLYRYVGNKCSFKTESTRYTDWTLRGIDANYVYFDGLIIPREQIKEINFQKTS